MIQDVRLAITILVFFAFLPAAKKLTIQLLRMIVQTMIVKNKTKLHLEIQAAANPTT